MRRHKQFGRDSCRHPDLSLQELDLSNVSFAEPYKWRTAIKGTRYNEELILAIWHAKRGEIDDVKSGPGSME